jgi:signal transduction histidine kinase
MDTRPGDRIAEELAALRRVAVLVARGAQPEEIFAAVTAEVRRLVGADLTVMSRYEPDGTVTNVALWSASGDSWGAVSSPPLGGRNVTTLVFETGRPARMDDFSLASGPIGDAGRMIGIRCSVGVPVSVEGWLWGVMVVSSVGEEPWPADTESRLAGFTELVGVAIANAQARVELRSRAEEEAALRRVATLVAGGAPPSEVFAAVAAEAGQLLSVDVTAVGRYGPGEVVTVVGTWSGGGTAIPSSSVGTRTTLGGRNTPTLIFLTRRPARIDDYADATGAAADIGRAWGFSATVGAPLTAEGRLWGMLSVASTHSESLPAGTEERLAGFAELAGTAIANAEAHGALAASRARIVAAADEARRRIERDLHDGAQQRLVTLSLQLRELRAAPPGPGELLQELGGIATGLDAALEELREIGRGIHPAVLASAGLRPALKSLARRCAVPVDLHVRVPDRPPGHAEIAAYYVVCEALTNAARHASATAAKVEVTADEDLLLVRVCDDGRGDADFGRGSGLVGLKDRVEALGGTISLHSPPGKGTTVEVHLPVRQGH